MDLRAPILTHFVLLASAHMHTPWGKQTSATNPSAPNPTSSFTSHSTHMNSHCWKKSPLKKCESEAYQFLLHLMAHLVPSSEPPQDHLLPQAPIPSTPLCWFLHESNSLHTELLISLLSAISEQQQRHCTGKQVSKLTTMKPELMQAQLIHSAAPRICGSKERLAMQ